MGRGHARNKNFRYRQRCHYEKEKESCGSEEVLFSGVKKEDQVKSGVAIVIRRNIIDLETKIVCKTNCVLRTNTKIFCDLRFTYNKNFVF